MDVTPEQLRDTGFAVQFDAVAETVSVADRDRGPNLAVVSDPYAGRDLLVDHAVTRLDDPTRVALEGVASGEELPELASRDAGDAVVVENCHYLFSREVGGFGCLEGFLEAIALSAPTVVTSWNAAAWSYLDAVRDVSQSFDSVVHLPPIDAVDLARLVEAHHDGPLPEFVQTSADGRVKTVSFDRATVSPLGGREVTVPMPNLNTEYLLSRDATETVGDVEAVVFQKLVQVAGGNPGVATACWDESVRDGQVAPGFVAEYDPQFSLDDDAAFVLELVVSNDRIRRQTLDQIRPTVQVDKALQTLAESGLVAVDGEWARVAPTHWRAAKEHLEGRQLLW